MIQNLSPSASDPKLSATAMPGTGTVHKGRHHRPSADMMKQMDSAIASLAGSADKAAQIEQDIKSAVGAALQSGGSPDSVRSAVDDVLKKNGIDPEALKQKLQSSFGIDHQA